MIYSFDLPKLIKRFLPTWARWPENLQWGYVLLSWLANIHTQFIAERDDVLEEYRYNGLDHSLENLLNNAYDPILRRVRILPFNWLPTVYYLDAAEAPVGYMTDAGTPADYYYLDILELNATVNHTFEFWIGIPAVVPFVAADVYAMVEIYRYAGRRPRIQLFDEFGDPIPDITLGP